MKLTKVWISRFRNILDSGEVSIQEDVTCLVGKNEAGKTAFLHALHRLRPARKGPNFDVPGQYPAWLEKAHRKEGIRLEQVRPVKAEFEIEDEDLAALEETFGPGSITNRTITLEREYSGKSFMTVQTNERVAVAHVISRAGLPQSVDGEARGAATFEGLSEVIQRLKARTDDQAAAQGAAVLEEQVQQALKGVSTFRQVVINVVDQRIPGFFYYDQYSVLPARVKVRHVLEAPDADLSEGEVTARSLLRLAAADNAYLLNPDYERRKRELENVANALTWDVLKYWSQNPELRVQIDITLETQPNPQGQPPIIVLDELKIRIWDERHWLSLPFDERSSGFRWFFSFLAAFSEFEQTDVPVIILLDEPALALHGRAQKDFLRFVEERLAGKHQVLYTTHSPFMVQPDRLERVRIFEDRGKEVGVTITQDVLTSDPDTLFPLQGALGYDLAQHLFIGPNNLVVEGTADYTFLTVLSDFLKERDGTHLDQRWTVVPVGGADLIPVFVALLGNKMDLTVVIDARTERHQRLARLAKDGYLALQRIVALGEVFGDAHTNIEDVFAGEDYLSLFNQAFGTSVKMSDLTGTDSIVNRIARHQGIDRFDHGRPADVLLRQRDQILPMLSEETLSRFQTLFERVNQTLA